MVELETRFFSLASQVLEMDVEIGDPVFRVEAHCHEQIRSRGWLAH